MKVNEVVESAKEERNHFKQIRFAASIIRKSSTQSPFIQTKSNESETTMEEKESIDITTLLKNAVKTMDAELEQQRKQKPSIKQPL